MAALQGLKMEPRPRISTRAIPKGIRDALRLIFQNAIGELWLVGGSALAGYYAEHRRSDDIDLFAGSETAQRSAVRAIKALRRAGASLDRESTTPIFYSAAIRFRGHSFTAAAVLDENIHRVGGAVHTKDGAWVADLRTLLSMKLACLVSRCSEKDLFDLDWIFDKAGTPLAQEIIELGQRIDGGVSAATLILSLVGTKPRKEACGFLLPASGMDIDRAYRRISRLRKKLIDMMFDFEKKSPLSPEARALAQSAKDSSI